MPRLRSVAVALVLGLILAACATRAPETEVGSDALVRGLWTQQELAGTDEDRTIGRITEPHCEGPDRARPEHLLPPLPDAMRGVIRRVDTGGRKLVALCFDLCERCTNIAGYNNLLVNWLREHRVRATFMAGGKWMRSHREQALQLMADPLFEMGNHAWTHGNLAMMDDQEIYDQVLFVQAYYEELRDELDARARAAGLGREMRRVPPVPRVFRLPYGRSSARALELLAGMGLPCVQWDVEGERHEDRLPPEEVAQNDLDITRPGSIYLLHANAVPRSTLTVVQTIVPALRAQGYEFVTISELLAAGPVEAVEDGYFTNPGDNLWLDDYFTGRGTMHKRDQVPAEQ